MLLYVNYVLLNITYDIYYLFIIHFKSGNRKRLDVHQGSGFFEIILDSDGIAEVKYLHRTRELEISPIGVGELRVQLVDLCLNTKPSVILVTVVSVAIIRVEMSDKVEIGKCISCVVRLFDDSDSLLTIPDMNMITLKANMDTAIATVRKEAEVQAVPTAELQPFNGELKYIITGR